MKYFVFGAIALMWSAGVFTCGWIFGARMTAREIADAIITGELSLNCSREKIAKQVNDGVYGAMK